MKIRENKICAYYLPKKNSPKIVGPLYLLPFFLITSRSQLIPASRRTFFQLCFCCWPVLLKGMKYDFYSHLGSNARVATQVEQKNVRGAWGMLTWGTCESCEHFYGFSAWGPPRRVKGTPCKVNEIQGPLASIFNLHLRVPWFRVFSPPSHPTLPTLSYIYKFGKFLLSWP